MMNAEQLEQQIANALDRGGYARFVVREATQVLDLAGEFFVEIVLTDASVEPTVQALLEPIVEASGRDNSSLIVRSKWTIQEIGKPIPAYGQDGGLRAAVLVPVTLESGQKKASVTVSITKLAEWELDRILGRKTDLGEVAGVVVGQALRLGGQSSWNPLAEDYLEVGSSSAANISRLLKRTA
jgi:hypothetical protein